MNNEQASALKALIEPLEFVYSEPIALTKKEFKKLAQGSWVQINAKELHFSVVEGGFKIANATLFAKDEFGYLKVEPIKKEPHSFIKSKSSFFTLRYNVKVSDKIKEYLVAKMPIGLVLQYKKRKMIIDLYIADAINIEIKELL